MRTRLSSWQVRQREETETMVYTEATLDTPSHPGTSSTIYTIPFPAGVEGMNIKSIKIRSVESVEFQVTILEEGTGDVLYESLNETKVHYDMVDLVYKPVMKAFQVQIHNRGSLATKFNIQIKGIEVR